MTKRLLDWLDDRTGYRGAMHEALEEPIPGGARWRYIFGSALTATFLIQAATGVLLMSSYSPGSTTAWGSVYYLNYEQTGGWLVRGIHHFGSQAMVVLLAMHLVQVLLAGAYRSPREMNWWFGMILMFLTLGLSLTGYLLPWDQKGYWATKVATNIMGSTPVVGPGLQSALVGGSEYGNQTLTRFYALHVGVLPALLVLALVFHVALFRKHGVTPPKRAEGMGKFWPEQVFMDTVGAALVLGILVLLTVYEGGANLDAPADPGASDYPARPEWYFLWLFQMLKLPAFAGEREILGTIVVPGAMVGLLLAMPLFDKIMPRGLAHFLACSIVFGILGVAGYLTFDAYREDWSKPEFLAARAKADAERARALALAASPDHGVPPDGAVYILGRDPLTRGRAVLERKCLSCHYYDGRGQMTEDGEGGTRSTPQTAADLKGYGSRAWLEGLLDRPDAPEYFGKVPQCGGMKVWKSTTKLNAEEIAQVVDFVATFAAIGEDVTPEEWAETLDEAFMEKYPGMDHFVNDCGRCHTLGSSGLTEGGEQEAPDLFAWGSARWTRRMIRKPDAHDRYAYLYDGEEREVPNMPAFPSDQLSDEDLDLIIKFLDGKYLAADAKPPALGPFAGSHGHGGTGGPEADAEVAPPGSGSGGE